MRPWTVAILITFSLCFACAVTKAQAQTISKPVHDLALKSGETTELSDVFWIGANCRSLLTGTPEVEVLDGPAGVKAVIKPASVVPRGWNCANAVQGGKLMIVAEDIQEHGSATMLLRINYKTKSGTRQRSMTLRLALVP